MISDHLCECGCGAPTEYAPRSHKAVGWVKGTPKRYLRGHNGRRPLEARLWEKVDKNGPVIREELGNCWTWKIFTDQDGYGRIWVNGANVAAHRASWFIVTGKWPEPQCLHRCDNPSCVRFSHLFEGTIVDNNADMAAKGRASWQRETVPMQKLTIPEVREIKRYLRSQIRHKDLAEMYGVSTSTISHIATERAWTRVNG